MGGLGREHGELRNACKILVDRPEGKRPFGEPRSGWEILKWGFRK
jgi:hypothetical protein